MYSTTSMLIKVVFNKKRTHTSIIKIINFLFLDSIGVMSPDGYTRSFDKDSNGYNRSEAMTCLFLQKKCDAKRIYANIVHCKTNTEGFKANGITQFSSVMKKQLLTEFYNEIQISPNKVGYIEAQGSGVPNADFEECNLIDETFCKGRCQPLLVGSVQSNIGYTEGASGISALVKICLAFQNGKIPPNINFSKPRPDIAGFAQGRLKVVTEIEDLNTPYIALNSFSLCGSNCHSLLKVYDKEKINFGIPEDNIPRLVNWASRTEEGVDTVFDFLDKKILDGELIGLIHNIQSDSVPSLMFRGSGLFKKDLNGNAECISRSVERYNGIRRQIVWVFSGMGSQWTGMGRDLMNIPIFNESIQRCQKALLPKGLNLIEIITSTDVTIFENILHSFVGIAAIQIGLVDVLRSLDLQPDYIIGHSVGELACGYADGGFTPEQMILCAYSRGRVSLESEKIKGSMAAIGIGYKDLIKILPDTIQVACHNSFESSTISGPAEEITKFVAELKEKKIFAKEVPCSNIPYHSRYISHLGPQLLQYLKKIIPNPKPRSSKWLCSSVPKSDWGLPDSSFCSAEYHTNNLLNSVLFEETVNLLPSDSLAIEIAPHGLLQAILKRSMTKASHVGLTLRGHNNNDEYFLQALGRYKTIKIYLI